MVRGGRDEMIGYDKQPHNPLSVLALDVSPASGQKCEVAIDGPPRAIAGHTPFPFFFLRVRFMEEI